MSDHPLRRLKMWLRSFFTHEITGPRRWRSRLYEELLDVGLLRRVWRNDGQISDGVYRSNNPGLARLRAVQAAGIKTVVNLRDDPDYAPMKFSRARCAQLGLGYVSHMMAPRRAPTRAELLALLELFPTLEKPVLFHCKSGADRTGLVAALWRMTQDGAPLAQARDELSIRYLHRRESETGVLDAVLDLFEDSGQDDIAIWIARDYDPAQAEARAQAARPTRGPWQGFRAVLGDLYRYGQHREAVWHASYEGPIDTPEARARAVYFTRWIDHGVLRTLWTNEAQVDAGLIRANHPTERRLRAHAARGLKTVINLRGASMQPQYQLEKHLCDELGLDLIDIAMDAYTPPPAAQALHLLDVLDRAPRPVLMHCKSGADRTGIAAALYVLDHGGSLDRARAQLSLRHLHLRRGKKGVLGAVLDAYAAQDKPLRDWLADGYDPAAIASAWEAARR